MVRNSHDFQDDGLSVRHRSRVAEQLEARARGEHTRNQIDWISFQAFTMAVIGTVAVVLILPLALGMLWFAGYGIGQLIFG
jgi:hypothetical protein